MATEVVEDGVLKSVVLDEGETSYATSPAVRIVGAMAIGADFAAGTVTLSDECEVVRDFAFFNNGHIRTLNIGRGLRTISPHSFAYRNALEKIEVSADNDTFSSVNGCLCDKAGETVHLGVNAEVMELPATCRAVDENAFAYCGGIRTLKLNSALESIGAYAFCDCSGIENVYVSANVVEIGKGAFCGCGGVNTITVDGSRNAGGTNIVNLLRVAFADIGKVSQVKITGRVGEIALLLGDGTFANTDIDTLVDTGSRPEDKWPYAKKYRNEDQTFTATFRYADPSDPSQVTEQQVTVSPGMPFGAIPLPGQFVGFTFDGWFYENQAEFGKQPITRDSIVKPMGDFTVVAKYVVEECLVRFYDSDGTTVLEEYTVEYGDTVTTPPSPAFDPDEYTFKGWLLEGTTDHYPAGETITVRSNMDFVARVVPIGLFDYAVVSTPTSTSVSVFGFNPYWSDDEITSELETSAGIYQLAIPDTMRVRVSGSMKTVKVRTVGYEPIYYDGVQIEPSDPHATKPDGTPLKPFGYFGSRIRFKDVTLGTNVTKVNDYAFKGFRSGKLILPYALARIGNYAFDGNNECEVRMENRIVDGVLQDNYNAAMCPVGENFVKVGEGAFRGIAYEKTIQHYVRRWAYSAGELMMNAYYDWETQGSTYSSSTWRVVSDISASENTSFSAIWSKLEPYARFYLRLEGSTVSIGKNAFEYANVDHFDSVNGLTVSSVPYRCFAGNETLRTEMSPPIDTPSIGISAFKGCLSLRAYPCRTSSIGASAFRYCWLMQNIDDLNYGVQVRSIGDYAFEGMGNYIDPYSYGGLDLATDCLDNAVIGIQAFMNSSLTSIDINPETIKSYAFSECWALTSVRLSMSEGEHLRPLTIMSYAFYGNLYSPIGELYVGRCISIGKYAFANNTSLNHAEISAPAGMLCDLGSSVFRECGLGYLKLVRCGEIGSSCFRDCYDLYSAVVDAVSIGDAAFYNAIYLQHLVMGTGGLRNIGASAFKCDEWRGMSPTLFWNPVDKVFGLALEKQVENEQTYVSSGYSWLVHSASTPQVVNLDTVEHWGYPAADGSRYIAGIAQKTFRGKESGGTDTVFLPTYGDNVYVEGSSERLKPRLCLSSFFGFSRTLEVYMSSPYSIADYAFDVANLNIHTTPEVLAQCEFDSSWMSICTGDVHFYDDRGLPFYPDLIIKGDVTASQFAGNQSIRRVVIEEGCSSIGASAFSGCSNLNAVVINPRSEPLQIGDCAFANTAITSIDLTNFAASSSSYDMACTAFDGCPSSLFSEVLGMYKVVGKYIVEVSNPVDGNHIYPNKYTQYENSNWNTIEYHFTKGVFDRAAVKNITTWYVDQIISSSNESTFDAGCLLSKETVVRAGKTYNNLQKVALGGDAVQRLEINRANIYADNEIELVLTGNLEAIRVAEGVSLHFTKELRVVWDYDNNGPWATWVQLFESARDNPLSHGAKLYYGNAASGAEAELISEIVIEDGVEVAPYVFYGYQWATSVEFENTTSTIVGRDAFVGMKATLYDDTVVAGALVLDGWIVGLTEYGKTAAGFDIAGKGIRGISNYAFAEHDGVAAITADYDELFDIAFTEESAYNTTGLIVEIYGVRVYRGEIIGPASAGFTGAVSIGNQYEIRSIRQEAFLHNETLRYLRIDKGTVMCEYECFADAYNMGSFQILNGVSYIGTRAFYNTLITKVEWIKTDFISAEAFMNCKSLTTITTGTRFGNLSVDISAFAGCTSLKEMFRTAWSTSRLITLVDIAQGAFTYCSSLESVDIGNVNTTKAIGRLAFQGCTSLTHVQVNWMVKAPEDGAFRNCPISSLKITGCILDSRGNMQTIETSSHFGRNIEVLQIVPREGIVWIDMEDMVKLNTLSIENPDTVKVMWLHYDWYSWLGDDVPQEFMDKYFYTDSDGNVICIVDGWFMFIYHRLSGGLLDLTDYRDGEGNRMQVIGMATYAALGWDIEEVRFGAELQRLSICAFSNDGTYSEDYELTRVVFYGNAPTISPDGYMWAETEEEAKETIFDNCPIVSVYVTRGSTGWGVTPREPGSVYSITLISVSSAGGAFRDAEHDVLGAAYPICWVFRQSKGDRYFYTATDAPARGDAVFADSDGNQSAGTVEYTEDSGPKWCNRPIYYRN